MHRFWSGKYGTGKAILTAATRKKITVPVSNMLKILNFMLA
jgi:hypothetical protein